MLKCVLWEWSSHRIKHCYMHGSTTRLADGWRMLRQRSLYQCLATFWTRAIFLENKHFTSSLVLWSFKPGTLTRADFLRNLRRIFKLVARGPVSSGPLVLPLMIEILAPLTACSTRACATWWLTRFDWLSCNGAQSHWHKGMKQKAMSEPPILQQLQQWQLQQGQQLPSKSSDDFARALAITVD
jgi:hypothetical protein